MSRKDPREHIVCRCEEITRGEILDAIERGDVTLDSIKRRTRAGMGLCQGKTCARLISRIICEQTGKKMDEIDPPRKRQPVNPISLGALASGAQRDTITTWADYKKWIKEE